MTLYCFMCKSSHTSLTLLIWHLKRAHAVYPHSDIPCGQNGCPKVCVNFRSLRSHISKHHSDIIDNVMSENNISGSNTNEVDLQAVVQNVDYATISDIDQHQFDFDNSVNMQNMQDYIQGAFITFISKLLARSNILLTNAKFVTENIQELLKDTSICVSQRIHAVFRELGVDETAPCIQELFHDLQNISSSINNVDTEYKQMAYFMRQCLYIKPLPVPVGERVENCKSSARVRKIQNAMKNTTLSPNLRATKAIEDTAQYIPVEVLLARIIIECRSNSLSLNCRTHASHDGSIADFFDTETYRKHPFFSRFPDALVLHFYIDGFETTNPLGPHTQIHKMEGLYMMIRNLPSKFLSKESAIFLVGIWYAQDAKNKTRSYDKILAPLIKTLRQLETDNGIDVNICGQVVNVRAALALFSADNLGYHSLFGFLENFKARKFCRLCEATKEESQANFYEANFVKRTKLSYDEAVNMIDQPGYNEAATGIKHGCIFNSLRYFHVMDNFAVDAMHDLLEGIVPLEMSLVLLALQADGYITLDEFNKLLTEFEFDLSDLNSRPTTFSTFGRLKMTASECWCLVRNLPFIMGHKVPRDEPHWNLILLLKEMLDIIFAPKINAGLASYLSHIIADHHKLYCDLFPEKI